MSSPPATGALRHDENTRCLARSVVNTLAEEPALEAVTIDRAHQKISVATLGRADVARLTERITTQFQAAQAADADHVCSLLERQGRLLLVRHAVVRGRTQENHDPKRRPDDHHRARDLPDRAELLALARHAVSQGRPARRRVSRTRRGDRRMETAAGRRDSVRRFRAGRILPACAVQDSCLRSGLSGGRFLSGGGGLGTVAEAHD